VSRKRVGLINEVYNWIMENIGQKRLKQRTSTTAALTQSDWTVNDRCSASRTLFLMWAKLIKSWPGEIVDVIQHPGRFDLCEIIYCILILFVDISPIFSPLWLKILSLEFQFITRVFPNYTLFYFPSTVDGKKRMLYMLFSVLTPVKPPTPSHPQ